MVPKIFIAAISLGLFLLVFWRAKIGPAARNALVTIRGAIRAMGDPALDELVREKVVQQAAMTLIVVSGSLVLRSFAALAAAFVPIGLADRWALVPMAAMLDFMERGDVILVSTVGVTLAFVAGAYVSAR